MKTMDTTRAMAASPSRRDKSPPVNPPPGVKVPTVSVVEEEGMSGLILKKKSQIRKMTTTADTIAASGFGRSSNDLLTKGLTLESASDNAVHPPMRKHPDLSPRKGSRTVPFTPQS